MLMIFLFILLTNQIVRSQLVKTGALIGYASECTPEIFSQTGSCTLTCSGSLSSLQDDTAKIVGHNFIYYSTNSEESVQIFYYTWNENGGNFSMSLPLSVYYAGTYLCEVQIQTSGGSKTYSNPFKIDPNSVGVPLGGRCASVADCWALDSICVMVCSCSALTFIPYDQNPNTPACLPIVPSGGSCNNDEQCQLYYYLNYCIYNICQERTEASIGLTAGAIAGIVIACIVALIVIVSVGGILYKKCF